MARKPVQLMERDQLLRPVASPSETFIRPPAQVDAGANLRDLAQGLRQFDSGLNSYFEEEQKKKEAEDAVLAEADFHRSNGKGYAAGVADGTIPAQASQAYVKTWKALEGQTAGRVLEQKFWADYESWGGKNSEDPNAFQTFYQGWLKDNISDSQDPKVLAGLLPRLRSLSDTATQRWISDKDKATRQGMSDAAGAAAGNAIKDARTTALTTGKSVDYEGTYTKLDTLRTTLAGSGHTDVANDRTMIDTVTAMAIEQRDPRWLGYLDRKIPGKDYSLADTPYGRDVKQKTIDALDTIHRRNVTEARTEQTAQDKKTKEDATRGAINWLLENPGKPVPEEIMLKGEKVDGSFRKDVLQWGEQLRSAKKSANSEAVSEVNRNIINGGGMRTFKAAMDHGVFAGDPEGMRAAYKLAEDVEKSGVVFGDIMKSSAATDIMGTIKQRTFSKDDLSQPFAPEGLSDTGLAAQYDFKQMVLQWALQNPEAAKDPLKREEAIAKIGKLITERLGRKDEGAGEATYDRRGMEKLPNPYRPGQAVPTPTPTGPTAPIAAQDPKAPTGGAAQPQAPAQPAAPVWEEGAITKNPDGSSTKFATGGDGVKYVQKFDPKTGWQQPQPWSPPDVPAAQPQVPGAVQGNGGGAGGAGTPGGATPGQPQAAAPAGGASGGGGAVAGTPGPIEPGAAPASNTPISDAIGNTEAGRIAREGVAEAGRITTEALAAPEQFVEWLRSGAEGTKPPGGQTSGIGALMKTFGIESPQGFMSWLGTNLGIGGAQAATVPGDTAPPMQEMPAPAPQVPADAQPLIDGASLDPKVWPKFDEEAAPNPELAKAVSAAMREAITSKSYKPKGVFTLSTLKDDPVANRILDFISGPESSGNYNAIWGKAGNTEDLSKLTVAQILERQAATVKRGGQSATGRYQFIRKTLAGLVQEMGIDPGTKFTPELQDQMALHLLNRRGLESYRAGRMSLEKFANNLALEWASLPNLTTYRTKDGKLRREGASAYAGDGLNKSHVSTGSVRDVLDLTKM